MARHWDLAGGQVCRAGTNGHARLRLRPSLVTDPARAFHAQAQGQLIAQGQVDGEDAPRFSLYQAFVEGPLPGRGLPRVRVGRQELVYGSAFLLGGDSLVTRMGTNVCYRFDSAHNPLGSFAGTGWDRPHGIDISPSDGRIYIVDGVTTQVHVFDPVTFAELNAGYLAPDPGDKIVDLEFRRDTQITPVEHTTCRG